MSLKKLKPPIKLKSFIDTPITVGSIQYGFSDLIENEWIDSFPIYSQRMRRNFVIGAELIDKYLAQVNTELGKLEDSYNVLSEEKAREVSNFISDKVKELDRYKQSLQGSVDTKLQEAQNRINRMDEVLNGVRAKENVAGIITLNDIDERFKRYGIGVADSNNLADIYNRSLKTGIYLRDNNETEFIAFNWGNKCGRLAVRNDNHSLWYGSSIDGGKIIWTEYSKKSDLPTTASDTKEGIISENRVKELIDIQYKGYFREWQLILEINIGGKSSYKIGKIDMDWNEIFVSFHNQDSYYEIPENHKKVLHLTREMYDLENDLYWLGEPGGASRTIQIKNDGEIWTSSTANRYESVRIYTR